MENHKNFGTLPIEILRTITSMLTRKDLKSLRVLNKRLNLVSQETLFEAITVSTNFKSVAQLLYIASSKFYTDWRSCPTCSSTFDRRRAQDFPWIFTRRDAQRAISNCTRREAQKPSAQDLSLIQFAIPIPQENAKHPNYPLLGRGVSGTNHIRCKIYAVIL